MTYECLCAESPPDPLAFLITMAMVALFFYGVRESGKKGLVVFQFVHFWHEIVAETPNWNYHDRT